jgi:hypothetical protein
MFPDIAKTLLVLALIVALGIWMSSYARRKRQPHHWVNGLIQPATNLQPQASNLQPASGKSQPIDLSKPAVSLSEPVSQLDPAAANLIAPGSQRPAQLCSMDSILPGCPAGQQYGGMTLMAQTIYPNSYLPSAVYNSSAFIPGCDGFGYSPDPCFQ